MSIVAKRCGVKFSPPSIILIYENKDTSKTRKRIIPVRNFSQHSDCRRAAESLQDQERHRLFLRAVPLAQLERLLLVLRGHLTGESVEQSLEQQDLNRLSPAELQRRKAEMDELFERNRRRRGEPGFIYDLRVDFPDGGREPGSWDEEPSDDEI